MSRELPRKVRKELEIAIEKMVGPVEETLKNQLEGLIRNCHERLSREILRERQPDSQQVQDTQLSVEDPARDNAIAGPSHTLLNQLPLAFTVEAPQHTSLSQPTEDFVLQPWMFGAYDNPSFLDHSGTNVTLPSGPWWSLCSIDSPYQADISSPLASGKGKERVDSNEVYQA
jgi:hypothetical protein